MKIALFHMGSTMGGFASYTAHLYRALRIGGHEVKLMRPGARLETKMRLFTHEVPYQNVPIALARDCLVPAGWHMVITCLYWKVAPDFADELLRLGATLVVHDPTELSKELVAAVQKYGTRVVAIRSGNAIAFKATLTERVTYVPHPYVPVAVAKVARKFHAVAISRVDFDKHTEAIVAANKELPTEKQVRIYGRLNRMYEHHKLAKAHPDWRQFYFGEFPKTENAAVQLAAQSSLVVDMSLIAGDGGGTQYTFFEAWNAGSALVVDERWLHEGGEMQAGYNCVAATPETLAAVVRDGAPKAVYAGSRATMAAHSPESVGQAFSRFLEEQ